MALLHLIVREVDQGCNIACTSKPQQWHKPKSKGKIHEPDFLKNLVLHQAKGQFHTTPNDFEKSYRRNHDPRTFEYRKEKTLADFDLDRLKEITDGNCAILLYTALNHATEESTNIQKESAEELNPTVKVRSIPCITAEILKSSPGISLPEFKNTLKQEIKVDEQTIKHVAEETTSQSSSCEWFSLRQGRITASKISQCIKKVHADGSVSQNNNSLLGNLLQYTPPIQTKEMKHGMKMEQTCVNHYTAIQKKRHQHFKVTSTGLHISQQYPFIAASPDGIINCSCPAESPTCSAQGRKGCLEVKNPFTNDKIDIWARKPSSCLLIQQDGTIELNKDHQYYAQVQCQMFVTNTDYADFVVRTNAKSSNIHIERIIKDAEFVDNMITKCDIVFDKVVIPELYHGQVKTHYTLRFINEIVNNIVKDAVYLSESHPLVKFNGTKKLRLE